MNLGRRGPSELEEQILRLLIVRERHGYELAKLLRVEAAKAEVRGEGAGERAAAALLPLDGAVYPILRRLEHDGMVGGRWVDIGEGQPRRRYYVLTPLGQRAAARRSVVGSSLPAPDGARA